MRLHRFYISDPIGSQHEITINSAELTNQVRRVFRLKTGDSVILFDGSGLDYECTIADMGKENIVLNISNSTSSRFMSERKVHLYAAIVKKDTFEWIVEKATELGVTHITPLMAERTEKKSLNMERLNKLATEASEQSGRGSVPIIGEIIDFETSLKNVKETSSKTIAFHIEGEPFLIEIISTSRDPLDIFIGPEGGWSSKEIGMFHNNNIPVKCLGNQVLRAETAVVAALSLVMLGK